MKYHHYLKALHYFLIVARVGSMKQAAESLAVTQAAVSQQVRLLEEALGQRLFQRQHRALSLTQAGLQLLPHLEQAFAALEQGITSLTVEQDPHTLNLAVFPSFASRWLIPRLAGFYAFNPSVNIKLSMSDRYEDFGGKGVDLAIRFATAQSIEAQEDLVSHFLMKDYIYPVCHPSYLEQHNIKYIDDFNRVRLLDDTVSNISWDFWFDQQGLPRPYDQEDNRVRYDGSHYVVDSALSAQGVGMVRHSLVADAIAKKQLVRLFNSPVELESQYYLCAPQSHFNFTKVRCFAEWLLAEVERFESGL